MHSVILVSTQGKRHTGGNQPLSMGGIPYFGYSGPDWHQPSRLQPASRFAEAGPNPFLTPKATPLTSLSDVRKRIDAYDQKTAGDYFIESTAPWMARNVFGELGHEHYSLPKNHSLYEALPIGLKNWSDTRVSYEDIFGIKKIALEKPSQVSWWTFLSNKDVQKLYKSRVKSNFAGRTFKPMSPSSYLKHVVMQYNLVRVAEELRDGRILPAFAKLLGLATLCYDVMTKTKKHYHQAKLEEDGSLQSQLRTVWKTGTGGLQESLKSVVAWELGSIGYMLGAATFCIGVVPSTIAGCLVGGLLETAFKSMINGPDWSHPQTKHSQSLEYKSCQPQANHFFQTHLNVQA